MKYPYILPAKSYLFKGVFKLNTDLSIIPNSVNLSLTSVASRVTFLLSGTQISINKRFSGSGKKVAQEVAKAVAPKIPKELPTASTNTSSFFGSKSNPHQMQNVTAPVEATNQSTSPQNMVSVIIDKKHYIMSNDGSTKEIIQEPHNQFGVKNANQSYELYGLLTSSHGNTATSQNNNPRISNVKFDNSFTAIKNKKASMDCYGYPVSKNQSKTPIVDNYGFKVPSPDLGGQHGRMNSGIVVITPTEQKLLDIQEDVQATKYLQEDPVANANITRFMQELKENNNYQVMLSEESMDKLRTEEGNINTTQNTTIENTDIVNENGDEVD